MSLGTPTGVVPVLSTPFESDGSLDRKSFRRLASHVMSQNIDAVMFPGLASEEYKLSSDERRQLIGDLLDVALDHPTVTPIVSVSDHATVGAVRTVREVIDRGARAVNLLPPHFLQPSRTAVLEHIAEVLDAAKSVPVLLQYVPGGIGVALEPEDISNLFKTYPNLGAVKVEAKPPGRFIASLLAQENPVPSFVGNAGLYLLDALRNGAIGVQPGSSLTEVYLRLWNDWQTGNHESAKQYYFRLLEYFIGWATHQELISAVEKLIAHRRGLISHPHCRAPHRQLQGTDVEAVDRLLAEFADELHP